MYIVCMPCYASFCVFCLWIFSLPPLPTFLCRFISFFSLFCCCCCLSTTVCRLRWIFYAKLDIFSYHNDEWNEWWRKRGEGRYGEEKGDKLDHKQIQIAKWNRLNSCKCLALTQSHGQLAQIYTSHSNKQQKNPTKNEWIEPMCVWVLVCGLR